MKMDKVAGSQNDEFYTPSYAVYPILKHLEARGFQKVWCPFDTLERNFVKVLSKNGFNVIATHISNGEDFFNLDIDCDVIVSNPPYSRKGDVLKRLFELGKPFAMLVGVVGLFESEKRFQMFKANEFEILYMNRRVSYFKSYSEQKPSLNPPFSSVYVAKNVFPRQIVFEEITKLKDTK